MVNFAVFKNQKVECKVFLIRGIPESTNPILHYPTRSPPIGFHNYWKKTANGLDIYVYHERSGETGLLAQCLHLGELTCKQCVAVITV